MEWEIEIGGEFRHPTYMGDPVMQSVYVVEHENGTVLGVFKTEQDAIRSVRETYNPYYERSLSENYGGAYACYCGSYESTDVYIVRRFPLLSGTFDLNAKQS